LEIPIVSTDDIPVPPRDVRIRSVDVVPLADGRRVRLTLLLTPFLEAPTIEFGLADASGQVVSEATIIESTEARATIVLHLRGPCPPGAYHARVSVEYPEVGQVAEAEMEFSIEGGV
jgi:hypothetical protein